MESRRATRGVAEVVTAPVERAGMKLPPLSGSFLLHT